MLRGHPGCWCQQKWAGWSDEAPPPPGGQPATNTGGASALGGSCPSPQLPLPLAPGRGQAPDTFAPDSLLLGGAKSSQPRRMTSAPGLPAAGGAPLVPATGPQPTAPAAMPTEPEGLLPGGPVGNSSQGASQLFLTTPLARAISGVSVWAALALTCHQVNPPA